ncbi:thioredoxin [Leptolyngbya sp. NIES-3755]|nr:thioredoxin [Leptolyngbya sp. NIES-3755]
MFQPSLSDYAPISTRSLELQPQEIHLFSFKVTSIEKQGMSYRSQPQQYICHFTDRRFLFVSDQSKFSVDYDAIERFKLVRTLNLSTFAKLIFKATPIEVPKEWLIAVTPTEHSRSAAKDFVQLGNELIGVVPGGFQMIADDPQAIAQFKQEVQASSLPVIVDFVAAKCEPCQTMVPIINELAEQFAGQFNLIKVDIEKNPAIALHYNVDCFPTLMVMNSGTVIDRIVGVVPKPLLVKVLNNHLAKL